MSHPSSSGPSNSWDAYTGLSTGKHKTRQSDTSPGLSLTHPQHVLQDKPRTLGCLRSQSQTGSQDKKEHHTSHSQQSSRNFRSRSRSPAQESFSGSSPCSSQPKETENLLETLRNEITCPICLDYFTRPVSLRCGHYFCKTCISKYEKNSLYCPQCRKYSKRSSKRPSRELANIVELAKKLRLETVQACNRQRLCKRHQEPLKLFCEQDQTRICIICKESRDHKTHSVLPVQEAVQDFKKLIGSHVQALKERRRLLRASEETGERRYQANQGQIRGEKQATEAEFTQIYQSMKETEQLLVTELEDLNQECLQQRDAAAFNLLEEISNLDAEINAMERKCKQPTNEFLQDIGSTLSRCMNEQLLKPVDVSSAVDVSRKLAHLSVKNVAVKKFLKKYKDMVNLELEKTKRSTATSEEDQREEERL